MSQNSKIAQTNMQNNLRPDRQAARRKGVGGLAAAFFVGVVGGGAG